MFSINLGFDTRSQFLCPCNGVDLQGPIFGSKREFKFLNLDSVDGLIKY